MTVHLPEATPEQIILLAASGIIEAEELSAREPVEILQGLLDVNKELGMHQLAPSSSVLSSWLEDAAGKSGPLWFSVAGNIDTLTILKRRILDFQQYLDLKPKQVRKIRVIFARVTGEWLTELEVVSSESESDTAAGRSVRREDLGLEDASGRSGSTSGRMGGDHGYGPSDYGGHSGHSGYGGHGGHISGGYGGAASGERADVGGEDIPGDASAFGGGTELGGGTTKGDW